MKLFFMDIASLNLYMGFALAFLYAATHFLDPENHVQSNVQVLQATFAHRSKDVV